MPTESVLLLGAGGHAKVVYDALRQYDPTVGVDVRDDNIALNGQLFFDCTITAPIGDFTKLQARVHVAIGTNHVRQRIAVAALKANMLLHSIVHPVAVVSLRARVSAGAFVGAGAIIAPAAEVASGVIINHGAVVDHECHIGPWVHVGPNATLGGAVSVGEGCLIGAGAVILPGLSIGEWAVVAAGAVVTRNVESGATVAGVPARRIEKR
jgi:sugar O-acyltransferase (sialic acid O-acetyltransferase NeuD family)